MPTYVYECQTKRCRKQFEDIHGINDPPPVCPKCGGECKRIPSFRGGGHFGDTPKFHKPLRG